MFKLSLNLLKVIRLDKDLIKRYSTNKNATNSYLAEIAFKNFDYQSQPILANEVI